MSTQISFQDLSEDEAKQVHYGKRKGQYGYFLPPEVKIEGGGGWWEGGTLGSGALVCDILGLDPYLKLNNINIF